MKKLAFAVLAVMLVVVSAGAARAGGPAPFKCTGFVGAVTVSGDLEVPAGHTCVLEGTTVTCPCHGSQFDVTTGTVLRGPATENLPCYRVKVERGVVYVEV